MSGMFRATTVVGKDVEKASRSEQEQPISPVQKCPNKNWIDLWYKYDSDRPVANASYIILNESGQKIAGGKLNNNGFSHVTGIPDSLNSCTVVYTGDPKPFEIFNDKKPIKNPYVEAAKQGEKENEIVAAFREVSKPIVSLAIAYHQFNIAATEWTWGAIQGDWNEDQTLGQIVFDSAISLIPFVDQAADARDVTANLYQLTVKRRYDEFSPWFGLVLTTIGMIPELGTAIKGAVKAVVKVGKEAATFVLKKGVKFGEQLLVKSGIDIDSLIRAMNFFGEGNVVKWLRDQVDNFAKHKKFVMDQIRDILLKVKSKCKSLMNDVIESLNTTLAIIIDNIDEVLKRVTDYVSEIMDAFKKAIHDLTETVKDYWIKATTRTDNGARQIADGTTFAPAPKPAPVKSHPRASRLTKEQIEKIAKDAGMEPEELAGLIEHCNKTNRRVVVRFTNPKSLQWHGKPGFVPKNVDVKLKTSKSGDNAGLVVKPKEPMEDWEIENINALKKKGYEFDGAGNLIDPKGNKIYGDYDLQSVHSVDPNTGKSSDLLSNPGESNNVVAEVNGGMGRKDREMLEQRSPVQHGAENDFFVKADASGKPIYTKPDHPTDTIFDPKTGQVREAPAQGKMIPASKEDIESGKAVLGKQYGDDEKYLVVNPDGTSEVLENPHELYEMNRKLGLPWRYDAVPPTGEQLAVEQAKRAEKKRAMENMAATEAIAEKVQMENFIDDIIGDGKQFDFQQPSNYVEIGATPF